MKRMLIGIAAAASLAATGALAADLPAWTYTKAPVYVDPIYDWTGFYVGGNLGYSWGRSSDTSTLTNATTGAVLLTTSDRSDLNGIVGGGQIGYNWQMQNWLYGFEADIQGTGEKGTRNFTFSPGLIIGTNLVPTLVIPFALSQKIDWFGTVRGRVGVLATPRVLLYVTGGLAYGEVDSNETIVVTPFSNSNTKVGYTVGAGIEGVISGNWTAKLEYLYVDLGRVNGSFTLGTDTSSYSSRITDNVLRVGLNYKFGGPVVAKY
jgi:outer membrane immunogenic protein